jgi:hypothetical protein
MYSGSTLTNISGNLLGTHQKINRIARGALKDMLKDDKIFPSRRLLLHFEGKNGPDGMKSKSTGRDEPWHFYDPFDPEDGQLLEIIEDHYANLVKSLKGKNRERSAFEAAWLSHAILDGLTPSHHYPFEQKLQELRGGEDKEARDTIIKKIVIPGDSKAKMIKNNWEYWGAKGLFNLHFLFEWGAGMLILPLPGRIAVPNRYDIKTINRLGLNEYYKRIAREVALFDMYSRFYRRGWSPNLYRDIRRELAPRMAKTVTLAWYMAAKEAEVASAEV